MEKNLVCLFSKNHYSQRDFVSLTANGNDNAIYKTALNNLDECDIYVLDEFAKDFNINRPWVSPENFYIVFISVDSSEVEQWRK